MMIVTLSQQHGCNSTSVILPVKQRSGRRVSETRLTLRSDTLSFYWSKNLPETSARAWNENKSNDPRLKMSASWSCTQTQSVSVIDRTIKTQVSSPISVLQLYRIHTLHLARLITHMVQLALTLSCMWSWFRSHFSCFSGGSHGDHEGPVDESTGAD